MEDTPDPLDSAGHGEPLWKRPARVSKSEAIRRMAREMVSRGQPPRPKDIVLNLEESGIKVTGTQVTNALANTEFAFRRNRDGWERRQVLFPELAQAFRLVGLEDVQKANAFVEDLGSLERAMAALVVLQQLSGGDIAVVSQTPTPPSIPSPTPVPPMNRTMEAEMEALEQHRSGS